MKFFVHPKFEPRFKPGDKVWYIYGKKIAETEIRSVIFESVDQGDGQTALHCTGYTAGAINQESRSDVSFPIYELYADEKTALEQSRWHEVSGISKKEWRKAIGNEKMFASRGEFDCFEASNDSRSADLLSKCHIFGGLIERNVRFLEALIASRSVGQLPKTGGPLDRILSQLGVVVNVNV